MCVSVYVYVKGVFFFSFALLFRMMMMINLLMFAHVLAECVLVVGQEIALAANAFVVHLVDVSG